MRVRIIPDLPGLVIADTGQVQGPSRKWLRLFPKGDREYLHFNLYRERRWLQFPVHFVVCRAFHGPRPEGLVVRHLDGNSHNNHADNLSWGTQLENEADKVLHGTIVRGEKHPCAKLTASDVLVIREADESLSSLARVYGVAPTTIHNVRSGRTWRHV
jgi:hypothetical protein